MSDALESLNGLVVPLSEQGLLLPNVAVAELVGFRLTRVADNAPAWFLGWTQWREQVVPLVDPYILMGQTPASTERPPRTLILNAVGERAGVHFVGLRIFSIPRSRKVVRGEINALELHGEYIQQAVQLAEEPEVLVIPDLAAIEDELDKAGLLRP
ncbi:MAG: chemotaxis protein [Gammaproteobacteria bacterium HGW-Gammaproteobacteria-11]|nr:MAG: chemotaxis protein [Gammaproteobacteria bacterium HGW-Gammaproteobacteria-11]